jgi:site-specific recombinase XerD
MSSDAPSGPASLNLIPTPPAASTGVAALADWVAMAGAAFSPNTLRAWRADWKIFSRFCKRRGCRALPAASADVREFIFESMALPRKPATIRRYLTTIAQAHRAVHAPDPGQTEPVRLALLQMGRTLSARQKQARALVWSEIELFLSIAPRNLRDQRDRALVALAYDTMCRREELVSLDVEDIAPGESGSATALIRRSKTDQEGEGASPYVSAFTHRLLKAWLNAAQLTQGPLFVRIEGRRCTARLSAQSAASVFKKVGRWIGLKPEEWRAISGHSTRVGATQDLVALNIELASVMQAGRWKDTRMPLRYAEQGLAARGGMARAAQAQKKT